MIFEVVVKEEMTSGGMVPRLPECCSVFSQTKLDLTHTLVIKQRKRNSRINSCTTIRHGHPGVVLRYKNIYLLKFLVFLIL